MNSPQKKDTKRIWFGKIETEEQALTVIKYVFYFFFFVASLTIVLVYFMRSVGAIIDGLLYGGLAVLLLKLKSRIAAVSLLLLSLVSVIATFLNKIYVIETGGKNIFLAILMFWASIRAVQATFLLVALKKGTLKQ